MSTPSVLQFDVISLLCELIRSELDLSEEQVWVYNQKRNIPPTAGLFVVVSHVTSRPFALQNEWDDDEAGTFTEYQSCNVQETYKISLFSRDESARLRAWEVEAALGSIAAQQLQEQYCFQIGPLAQPFVDVSAVEASANLTRLDGMVQTIRAHYKSKAVSYFDKFTIPPTIHTNQ